MLGDAASQEFCSEAAAGAAVVYHCMNPPYSAKVWAELLPRYMQNLIAASARAGARLIVLDNVYMLGKPNGKRLTEDTPVIRRVGREKFAPGPPNLLFDAHKRGDVRATIARASDFYGPRGTLSSLWAISSGRACSRDAAARRSQIPTCFIPSTTSLTSPPGLRRLAPRRMMHLGHRGCSRASGWRPFARSVHRLEQPFGAPIRCRCARWMQARSGSSSRRFARCRRCATSGRGALRRRRHRVRTRFGATPEDPDRAAAATVEWARSHYGSGVPGIRDGIRTGESR